jgi:hypothetical protein
MHLTAPPRRQKNPLLPDIACGPQEPNHLSKPPRNDPRRKLNREQKMQLVQRLAGFDSPRNIIRWLREEHDVIISRKGVAYYDPTTYAGRGLVEHWKTLFFATRNAILEERAEIGAANKMVRVRWLDAMVHDAMDRDDPRLAAHLLAQVAKEMGESRTNRQKQHSGVQEDISEAELDRRIAAAAAALGLMLVPIPSPP